MAKVGESGKAIPFSIEYVSFDKKRKSGGRLIEYPEAILCFDTTKKNTSVSSSGGLKKPKHSVNNTRNIEILNSGQATQSIRKLNILLITKFNNQKVT